MSLVLASLLALPIQDAPEPSQVRPGPIALIVVPLAVAVFLLWRSLNKQLKRIDFDESAETDEERAARRSPDDDGAGH